MTTNNTTATTKKSTLTPQGLVCLLLETILPDTLNKRALPDDVRVQMIAEIGPVNEVLILPEANYSRAVTELNRINAMGRLAIASTILARVQLPDALKAGFQTELDILQGQFAEGKSHIYVGISKAATAFCTRVIDAKDDLRRQELAERANPLYADFKFLNSPEDQILMLSCLCSLKQSVSQNRHPDVNWDQVRENMSLDYVEGRLTYLAERIRSARAVTNFAASFRKDLDRDLSIVRQARQTRPPRNVRQAQRDLHDAAHVQAITTGGRTSKHREKVPA